MAANLLYFLLAHLNQGIGSGVGGPDTMPICKSGVVVDPAPDYRAQHSRNVFEGFVRLKMNPPSPDLLSHCFRSFVAYPGMKPMKNFPSRFFTRLGRKV